MRIVPLPESSPAGIALYRLDLDLAMEAEAAWPSLTDDERRRAAGFARRADRVRFAATRACTRQLLATRLGCTAAEVPLRTGLHGKPHVDGNVVDAPLFNVAHSGCHALVALADARRVLQVGVDIEHCRDDLRVEDVAALAFTEVERRALAAADDVRHAFYACWVGKEAALKAVGVGIAAHLQRIDVHPRAGRRFDVACREPAWAGLRVAGLRVPQGYTAALAWRARTKARQ